MIIKQLLASAALAAGLALAGSVSAADNRISAEVESVDVIHNGKIVTISRAGDKDHKIPEWYQKSSRHCPPFCVQPMSVSPGVETIGEMEMLAYLKRMSDGDASILVIDSRTPDWMPRGTIPGAVNIPWNTINIEQNAMFGLEGEAAGLADILKGQFGAKQTDTGWDYSNAKTLVMFCNGVWCPQSSVNIKTLVKMGYPASKLKWYRGGMQDWVTLGLTTVTP